VKSGYQREHEFLVPRYNKKAQTGDYQRIKLLTWIKCVSDAIWNSPITIL